MKTWMWIVLFGGAIVAHYVLPPSWVWYVTGILAWALLITISNKIDDLTQRVKSLEETVKHQESILDGVYEDTIGNIHNRLYDLEKQG